MKTEQNIYTHYAKIKMCIESCVTFDQRQSCYSMIDNLSKNFSLHKRVAVITEELIELYLEKEVK